MLFSCSLCDYQTNDQSNYKKHLKTKKHQKNEEKNTKEEENSTKKEEKTTIYLGYKTKNHPEYICEWCRRYFKRSDNLQRHLRCCKINISNKNSESSEVTQKKQPTNTNNNNSDNKFICHYCYLNCSKQSNLTRHYKTCNIFKFEQDKLEIEKLKLQDNYTRSHNVSKEPPNIFTSKQYSCNYCLNKYTNQKGLNRHLNSCHKKLKIVEQKDNEIEQLKINQKKEIKIIEQKKEIEKLDAINKEKQQTIDIAKNSQHITINNNNKTINFLNNNYGEMIAMETFLKSLEYTHQLTLQERKDLLNAYNECGIEVFARNFSYIMKQNCKRQLESQGIEDMKLLPLFCSDGNLRSHKEKQLDGWKTLYDNQSINQMLNISNQQIYDSYQQIVPISGRERTKIYKEVKRDNHQNKLIKNI